MLIKKPILIMVVAVLLGIATTISCKKHSDATPAGTDTVSFSAQIIPIFKANCAINSGCHLGANNTNDNISLDSSVAYSTIMAKQLVNTATPTASLMYVEISSGEMPKAPYPALSAANTKLILEWIQQGGKDN